MPQECETPLSRTQAMVLSTERRGRRVSVALVMFLLVFPLAFFTVVLPLLWPVELWYVVAMDATLVGIFLVWRLVVALGSAARRLRARQNIRRLREGDRLVHWRYDPDEWRRFADHEYRRDRCISRAFTSMRSGLIVAVVFGAFVTGMMLFVNRSEAGPDGAGVVPPAAIALTGGIAFALPIVVTALQILNFMLGDRAAAQARRLVPEVQLNRHGVDGVPARYFAFIPKKTKLSVMEDGGFPILRVAVQHDVQTRFGRYPLTKVERILIPRGCEEEAASLALQSARW